MARITNAIDRLTLLCDNSGMIIGGAVRIRTETLALETSKGAILNADTIKAL